MKCVMTIVLQIRVVDLLNIKYDSESQDLSSMHISNHWMRRGEKRVCQILLEENGGYDIIRDPKNKPERKIYGTWKFKPKNDHKIYSTKGSKERCSKNNKK